MSFDEKYRQETLVLDKSLLLILKEDQPGMLQRPLKKESTMAITEKDKILRKDYYQELNNRDSQKRVNRIARLDLEASFDDFENNRQKYAYERQLTGLDESDLELYEFYRSGVDL